MVSSSNHDPFCLPGNSLHHKTSRDAQDVRDARDWSAAPCGITLQISPSNFTTRFWVVAGLTLCTNVPLFGLYLGPFFGTKQNYTIFTLSVTNAHAPICCTPMWEFLIKGWPTEWVHRGGGGGLKIWTCLFGSVLLLWCFLGFPSVCKKVLPFSSLSALGRLFLKPLSQIFLSLVFEGLIYSLHPGFL